MNEKTVSIGSRIVGSQQPCFVIAEMSANHLMEKERAYRIIDAAVEAGADAIKIQTYTPDTITLDCDNDYFQITQGTIWDGTTLHKLYEEAYTPWEWQLDLKRYADSKNIIFFSSPFDLTAVDFLEEIDVLAYKIASFEITDIPLLERVARTGKPIFISTGIAYLEDIERALNVCRRNGNDRIVLLKCTSAYPSPYEGMNIRTIPNMAETFDVVSGLSDHSLGTEVAVAAVALGASAIEKHLTLAREEGGPDAVFSMEPEEFSRMVREIRNVEKALGRATYELSDRQIKSREHSRSLFAVKPISKGEVFTSDNIRSVRPAFGLHTRYYSDLLGRHASSDIAVGTPLSWDLVDD